MLTEGTDIQKDSQTEEQTSKRTDKQKNSQDAYMKKLKDIKLRVPEEYLKKIQEHAKNKGMSVNKLIISLLEKDMGERIITIREKNKLEKKESGL